MKKYIGSVILASLIAFVTYHDLQSPRFNGWKMVVVQDGQNEWTIGQQYCPAADTRDVVDAIEAHNHSNGNVQPGETLWVPTRTP